MFLENEELDMLEGRRGAGPKKSMEILVKFGRAFGAARMTKIASAHVIPNIPINLLEEMTEGVDRPAVFTTLHPHMSAFSPESWSEMGISPDYAERNLQDVERRKKLFQEKGFFQTYTCFPAMVGNLPKKGDLISWIGSGGQVIVNSLLGARCNRDGAVITLAAAITGRAPYRGLFLDSERHAKVLVRLRGLDPSALSPVELGAIGYFLGEKAGDRNIVIEGFSPDFGLERMRYLMVPLTVTGAVGVCHIVGVTPEAATIEQALGGKAPEETIEVTPQTIRQARGLYRHVGAPEDLFFPPLANSCNGPEPATGSATPHSVPSDTPAAEADMVLFGCPHLSINEVRQVAEFLDGRKVKPGKFLWIGFAHQQYKLAEEMGYVRTVERAGGAFASACMSAIPDAPIPESVRVIRTQSFKAAHYISRLTQGRAKVDVADMTTCLESITENA